MIGGDRIAVAEVVVEVLVVEVALVLVEVA